MLALLDIPGWCTEEYNRWYDLDHMPEHLSKPDVLAGRRYVRPKHFLGAAGALPSEWIGGFPPYLTTYWFGGPLDYLGQEALSGWQTMDRRIVKAGRYWRVGRGVHNSRWRVTDAMGRPSVLVSPPAVPYLAHRGVIVAAGRVGPGGLEPAIHWWDTVHLVDLFTVPGLLASVRMEPAQSEHDGMLLHLLLCEEPPDQVLAAIERAKRYWTSVGRFPAHGGVYEPVAFLPYRQIVPLEYDFDIGGQE